MKSPEEANCNQERRESSVVSRGQCAGEATARLPAPWVPRVAATADPAQRH